MSDKNNLLALKDGTTLQGGKYVIRRKLGQGGFGITYEAMATELNKRVVIKEYFVNGICGRDEDEKTVVVYLDANKELFERQKKRFLDEAKKLAGLHNEHLVTVHDLFKENETSYYVMDFIEGESLYERLQQSEEPLSERETMAILKQMLDALECIHNQDPPLCHLDIKPANIMVGDDGHVVLIDFGASKYAATKEDTLMSSSVVYTPGYAPFEQLSGDRKRMGPWTDFYALGATLFCMLSLKRPSNPSDIMADTEPNKASSIPLPSSVSPRMRNLVLWMMAVNQKERPQSVYEIRNFINAREDIHPHPPEPPKPKPRKSWLKPAGFVLLAAIVMLLGWGIFHKRNEGIDHTVWDADNIEIVYLKDSTQYVCDPENLLKPQEKDTANYYLNLLNHEFGIQNTFIVVNHVKDADAFKMSQDVGNKYGIGDKDAKNGLVVVLAVGDRKYFIATGKGLSINLTDSICSNIANKFIKPNMWAGNTGLAVAETSKAIYWQIKTDEERRSNLQENEAQKDDTYGIAPAPQFTEASIELPEPEYGWETGTEKVDEPFVGYVVSYNYYEDVEGRDIEFVMSDAKTRVKSKFYISRQDLYRAAESWLPYILVEGNKVKIQYYYSGNGGYQYVISMENLPR